MRTLAKITTQFEGIHCWPDAVPGKYNLLKHPHRHMFHVTVLIEQFHNNRDIEYLLFKDWLNGQLETGELNNQSCEMIAENLIERIQMRWGDNRAVTVEVTEDGENGAVVTT